MIAPKDNIKLDGLEECVIGTELQEDTLVYWLRIQKQGSVKNNLLELVELETK